MNGPVFVNLPDAIHISKPVYANEARPVHKEHDDADGPTVDQVVISPDPHTIRNNLRR
jgi:hypothetical protein